MKEMAFFSHNCYVDGHLCFIFERENSLHLVCGVSNRGLLSSFGGRAQLYESLGAILFREYVEESHEAIVGITKLGEYLHTRTFSSFLPRIRGQMAYVGFVCLEKGFDFERARRLFKIHKQRLSSCARVPGAYAEIIDITQIPLENLDITQRAFRPAFKDTLNTSLQDHLKDIYKLYDL